MGSKTHFKIILNAFAVAIKKKKSYAFSYNIETYNSSLSHVCSMNFQCNLASSSHGTQGHSALESTVITSILLLFKHTCR